MKSISVKLFLALLGLTSLMLVATLMLARWSFDQGFLDYVNSQQQRRLARMASDLSEYYVDSEYRWADDTEEAYQDAFLKWYPRTGRGRRGRNRQASSEGADTSSRAESRRSGRPPARIPPPIAFYDIYGEPLAGMPELLKGQKVLRVDVVVDDSKVAELRTIPRSDVNLSYESQFSKQQTNVSIIIAILCLFIAGVASWFLSRMLLAPSIRMRETVRHLARGDYGQRINTVRNDELGVLMDDINRLAETLDKNQQARKRWLADISHELRTPVAILSGEISAMLDGIRPLNMGYIKSLNHEVVRLERLIDDLYQVSLSDIGGLRYEFSEVNISRLLEVMVAQNQARVEESSLALSAELPPDIYIDGDSSRLEQLFTNLINNSISYTDTPGRLIINLSVIDDEAVIVFSDSAPGISEERIELLFEPLFRGDESRSRQVGGAGLGLTICRNIVLAHKGEIDVKNSSYGGLDFTIRFPVVNKK